MSSEAPGIDLGGGCSSIPASMSASRLSPRLRRKMSSAGSSSLRLERTDLTEARASEPWRLPSNCREGLRLSTPSKASPLRALPSAAGALSSHACDDARFDDCRIDEARSDGAGMWMLSAAGSNGAGNTLFCPC